MNSFCGECVESRLLFSSRTPCYNNHLCVHCRRIEKLLACSHALPCAVITVRSSQLMNAQRVITYHYLPSPTPSNTTTMRKTCRAHTSTATCIPVVGRCLTVERLRHLPSLQVRYTVPMFVWCWVLEIRACDKLLYEPGGS